MPKFFEDDVLIDIGLDKEIIILYDQVGCTKFSNIKYNTFYELTIQFYTTLKFVDENKQVFLCRFFSKECHFDFELMSEIFSLLMEDFIILQ